LADEEGVMIQHYSYQGFGQPPGWTEDFSEMITAANQCERGLARIDKSSCPRLYAATSPAPAKCVPGGVADEQDRLLPAGSKIVFLSKQDNEEKQDIWFVLPAGDSYLQSKCVGGGSFLPRYKPPWLAIAGAGALLLYLIRKRR
jgi:hypothetical protein